MKKFEYLKIYAYISEEKKEWVVRYQDTEFPLFEYQEVIFCELGSQGWELVSALGTIEGSVESRLLFSRFNAEGDVGVSSTALESFYFKREIEDDVVRDIDFSNKIDEIRRLTSTKKEIEKVEQESIANFSDYGDSLGKYLILQGYSVGEAIVDTDISYYKSYEEEYVDKSLLGKKTLKTKTIEKRVDLVLGTSKIEFIISSTIKIYVPITLINFNLVGNMFNNLLDFSNFK